MHIHSAKWENHFVTCFYCLIRASSACLCQKCSSEADDDFSHLKTVITLILWVKSAVSAPLRTFCTWYQYVVWLITSGIYLACPLCTQLRSDCIKSTSDSRKSRSWELCPKEGDVWRNVREDNERWGRSACWHTPRSVGLEGTSLNRHVDFFKSRASQPKALLLWWKQPKLKWPRIFRWRRQRWLVTTCCKQTQPGLSSGTPKRPNQRWLINWQSNGENKPHYFVNVIITLFVLGNASRKHSAGIWQSNK